MDPAVASVVLTAIAGVFGIAAFVRGEMARRANVKVDAFTAVTGAQGGFIAILQAQVAELRDEVKACNRDKAEMKVKFEAQIGALQAEVRDLKGQR